MLTCGCCGDLCVQVQLVDVDPLVPRQRRVPRPRLQPHPALVLELALPQVLAEAGGALCE